MLTYNIINMFGGLVNEVAQLHKRRLRRGLLNDIGMVPINYELRLKQFEKNHVAIEKRAEKRRIKNGTQWAYLELKIKDELSKVRMYDKFAQEHRDNFAELLQKQKELV